MGIQTYQDCIDNLLDFAGTGPSDQALRQARQAIQDAYREFANAHRWPSLYRQGRIWTYAPYSGPDGGSATVAYLHSSGSVIRQLTLSGGTWPLWCVGGSIYLGSPDGGGNAYRVVARLSATVVLLDDELNPGEDVASTPFVLYQDCYPMPDDLMESDQPLHELNIGGMSFVRPSEWLFSQRYQPSNGDPRWYTILGDKLYPGRLVMRVSPSPVASRSIDFMYKRRPRPLRAQMVTGGTVSTVGGTPNLKASSPIFTSALVGSVVRVSGTVKPPTSENGSLGGYNPPVLESCIQAIVSPTVAVLSSPAPSTLNGVGYYISDPVDFQQGPMLSAFLRCMEKCYSTIRKAKTLRDDQANYQLALADAQAAASPSFAGQAAGPRWGGRLRLRDRGFVGPDQP